MMAGTTETLKGHFRVALSARVSERARSFLGAGHLGRFGKTGEPLSN